MQKLRKGSGLVLKASKSRKTQPIDTLHGIAPLPMIRHVAVVEGAAAQVCVDLRMVEEDLLERFFGEKCHLHLQMQFL